MDIVYQAAGFAAGAFIEMVDDDYGDAFAVGERERVIASTDCGFGTFAGREWVSAPIVWKKLQALRQGADIASARLWG